MGRFLKNYMLPFSAVLTAIGLVLTVLSWWVAYSEAAYFDWYRTLLHPINDMASGDVNLILMIGSPILLVSAGWYFGEQIVKRRRFERLFATEKKSDFARNRKDLEDISRDLPDSYRKRVRDKEKTLSGTRESGRER